MNGIGFRAGSKEVYWAVVSLDGSEYHLTHVDRIRSAKVDDLAQSLADYRSQIISIYDEYNITAAGIRTAEPIARTMGAAAREGAIKRNRVEGVILESMAGKGFPYVIGPSSTLKSKVGGRQSMKGYVEADEFHGIDGWEALSSERKEAVYAAVAAIGLLK